jgi:protein-S-isoprenylcysteine O-methyltransferase Ste14
MGGREINWPALCVGAIIAAYWWRVLRMAYKMRRQTGRAANFVPAEPIGKILRVIWQPIVWMWIAGPIAAGFGVRSPRLLTPMYDLSIIRWIAVAIAAVAFALTRICWKQMGKSWRMGIDPNERTSLIVTGPYAYVRNPIYALSNVLMVATAVAVPTPLMIFAAAVHLLLLQWEARREERHLSQILGAEYDQYRAAVGRFVPRSLQGYPPHSS